MTALSDPTGAVGWRGVVGTLGRDPRFQQRRNHSRSAMHDRAPGVAETTQRIRIAPSNVESMPGYGQTTFRNPITSASAPQRRPHARTRKLRVAAGLWRATPDEVAESRGRAASHSLRWTRIPVKSTFNRSRVAPLLKAINCVVFLPMGLCALAF